MMMENQAKELNRQELLRQLPPLFQLGKEVIEELEVAGYEAYFVGGAVRDYLLGRPIHDLDIATSARPEEVLQLFPQTIPTGLAHGTVTVRWQGYSFEVTTFRREGAYIDRRHPSSVQYVTSLTADLARRDLTINAMALDREGRLYDPFGGYQDMEARLLRAVGEPQQRFTEDALRILRLFRFHAQLGFQIEEATLAGAMAAREGLAVIAAERIADELWRLLQGRYFLQALEQLAQLKLLHHPRLSTVEKWLHALPYKELAPLKQLATYSQSEEVRLLYLTCYANLNEEELASLLRELFLCRERRRRLLSAYHLLREWLHMGFAAESWEASWLALEEASIQLAWQAYWVVGTLKGLTIPPHETEEELEKLRSQLLAERSQAWQEWQRFYASLPIRQASELAFDGQMLLQLIPEPAGPWIARRLEQLLYAVHKGYVPNREAELRRFIQRGYEREQELASYLETKWLGRRLYVLPVTDTTQREAHRLWHKGSESGTVVIAEEQRAARGTRGRSWYSPADAGAWLSCLIALPIPITDTPIITILTAVALYETLLHWVPASRLQIKWPNDLLLDQKKCAGILTELHQHDGDEVKLVVGVGINLNQGRADFPPELQGRASSLAMVVGAPLSPVVVSATFLQKMEVWIERFLQEGAIEIIQAWECYSGMIGQELNARQGKALLSGTALGLDQQGRLLLMDDQGVTHTLISGEILPPDIEE